MMPGNGSSRLKYVKMYNIYMHKNDELVHVRVTSGQQNTYRYKRELRNFGLQYGERAWFGTMPQKEAERIARFSKPRGLTCRVYDSFSERSANYRRNFFYDTKPVIGNLYFCAYCGKLVPRRKITVDHVIPVYAAQTSRKWRRRLEKAGCSSVNDPGNLVAACEHCNKSKGSKTSLLWLVRAKIGRNNILWILRWFVRAVCLWAVLYYCYYCFGRPL